MVLVPQARAAVIIALYYFRLTPPHGTIPTNPPGDVELSMIEAMATAAVLTDDATLLHRALHMWRERLPSFIYVEELDGRTPRPPPRTRAKIMHLRSPSLMWFVREASGLL